MVISAFEDVAQAFQYLLKHRNQVSIMLLTPPKYNLKDRLKEKRAHSVEPLDVFLFDFEWQLQVSLPVRRNTTKYSNWHSKSIRFNYDAGFLSDFVRVLEIRSIRLYGFMSFGGKMPETCDFFLIFKTLYRWSKTNKKKMKKTATLKFHLVRKRDETSSEYLLLLSFGGSSSVEWML